MTLRMLVSSRIDKFIMGIIHHLPATLYTHDSELNTPPSSSEKKQTTMVAIKKSNHNSHVYFKLLNCLLKSMDSVHVMYA